MTNEEAIKVMNTIIAGVKHNIQLPMTVNEIEDACYMAIEALKEMSHLHLICPHCLNDFYYNKITQSFELKEGEKQ